MGKFDEVIAWCRKHRQLDREEVDYLEKGERRAREAGARRDASRMMRDEWGVSVLPQHVTTAIDKHFNAEANFPEPIGNSAPREQGKAATDMATLSTTGLGRADKP